jgi:hypothetical protein
MSTPNIERKPNTIDYTGLNIYTTDTDQSLAFSMAPSIQGLQLEFDLLTAAKQFKITKDGINFNDGTNNFTTALSRLAAIQEAFASVELPPDATTLAIENKVLLTNTGDVHESHLTNTELHIFDNTTNDEMFIDHNSLILVQPTTGEQFEVVPNMLDFQNSTTIVSLGQKTYISGEPGIEIYDLTTGTDTHLRSSGLSIVDGSTGHLSSLDSDLLTINNSINQSTLEPKSITLSTIGGDYTTLSNGSLLYNNGVSSIFASTEDIINMANGSSSNASTIDLSLDATSGSYPMVFSKLSAGTARPLYVNNVTYNPILNTLNATTFNGTDFTGLAATSSAVTLTADNTSGTYYIPFSKTAAGTSKPLYIDSVTGPLSYNPSTSTLTATVFSGSATNASAITLTTDNTSGAYYIPFSKTAAGTTKPLYIDDTTTPLTYNPSTSTLTATNFNGLLSSDGLVYLQNITGTINGNGTPTTFTFPSIFNTTYKNYKIIFSFGITNTAAMYPSISLNGFSGLNVPIVGDMYGYDMTSGTLAAVSVVNSTLSTSPLQMTGACLPNGFITFEVNNVGYTTTQSNNIVTIVSNSVYNNPGVKGIRNIQVMINQNSSSTITGLSLQSQLGGGNSSNWNASIYGYK